MVTRASARRARARSRQPVRSGRRRARKRRLGYLLDRLASYRQGALAAYAAARPLFERALAIREKALGPEHPLTATTLNNLAVLLQDQGDLAGARSLNERALAIREKALGPEHPIDRHEPQQPRPSASRPGRPRRRAAALRAGAGDPREGARPRASDRPPRASTTSPVCFTTRATSLARGRSSSGRWRSARRRSAPSIP